MICISMQNGQICCGFIKFSLSPYDSFIKYSITQIKIMYIAALNKYFFLHSLLESVNVLFRSLAFLRCNKISFIDALSTYHKSSSFAKKCKLMKSAMGINCINTVIVSK